MIDEVFFNEKAYPAFQAHGNASQFAIPFASHVCKGYGFDVGCHKIEWAFPGAIPIDIFFDDPFDANNLPERDPDYIYSSHCLEHVENWVATLDYWYERLLVGGVLFLYLPDFSQEYWRPWNNYKHRHCLTPAIIYSYLAAKKYKKIFISGIDLNNSFMAMAEK